MTPSSQALDHLRLVARGLHAITTATQLTTTDTDYTTRDSQLFLSSAAARDRLVSLARELLWYVARLRPSRPEILPGADALEARCASG